MKTSHAILIGLSLIAAAIFFKDRLTTPAHAFGGPDHIACVRDNASLCWAFNGNTATLFNPFYGFDNDKQKFRIVNWRTGESIK